MFEKIVFETTYGYRNFIGEDIQKNLLDWVNLNLDSFVFNPAGPGRKTRTIVNTDEIYTTVQDIKRKIMILENQNLEEIDFSFRDYIGINFPNAFIQLHTDDAKLGRIHTRWNLILSYPEEGGHSIYNGKTNQLEERLIWKCEASRFAHGSTKVKGIKPRITLSLGFML